VLQEDESLAVEDEILRAMAGEFVTITDPTRRNERIKTLALNLKPRITQEEIDKITADIMDLGKIGELASDQYVEDVMVNNTRNVFVADSRTGTYKTPFKFETNAELARFVAKLRLYQTNQDAGGKITDVYLPSGSRGNIISSPLGYDVTIRNFRTQPLSIIDLINAGTIDYRLAARLWLYTDGFRIRPANLLIGGVPAAGKTTLLNAMFSFFRPEQRIVTIEETYELNSSIHENVVRLETDQNLTMTDLVKNSLRMRPDMIIIGEVRGAEANDMIAAMNIGKICMTTIHASTTRDIINRLEHSPMNVPQDMLLAVDALVICAFVNQKGKQTRKVVQLSEISGIETKVLLSDLYRFDYRTNTSTAILPSVTYRDTLAKILGIPPMDIIAEEAVRAKVLEQLNKMGKRDIASISQAVSDYYTNPDDLLKRIGMGSVSPVIRV
jgi:flagellar protein FlaI